MHAGKERGPGLLALRPRSRSSRARAHSVCWLQLDLVQRGKKKRENGAAKGELIVVGMRAVLCFLHLVLAFIIDRLRPCLQVLERRLVPCLRLVQRWRHGPR